MARLKGLKMRNRFKQVTVTFDIDTDLPDDDILCNVETYLGRFKPRNLEAKVSNVVQVRAQRVDADDYPLPEGEVGLTRHSKRF
jgi:hypothetical protein